MKCKNCSAEYNDVLCKKCIKQDILESLEIFIDENYPPSQYKNFNARMKSRIKELIEK